MRYADRSPCALPSRTARTRGYTLIEALVALAVAALLIAGLAAVLMLVGRLALRQARAAATAETERIVPAILGPELQTLTAADAVSGPDSIYLRVFRGGGAICARIGSGLVIEYDGVRSPDADKDSVLLIWEDGEIAQDISAIEPATSCAGAGVVRLDLVDAIDSGPPPLFALVYETGTYSIGAAAFRYRRGGAGRQPLTEANLSSRSALELSVASDVAAIARVALVPAGVTGPAPFGWTMRLPQGALRPSLHEP